MATTPLHRLHDAGQSIWLDYIDRPMLRNGDLARRIRDDALTGMTSNPTIFEKALAEGSAYDEQIRSMDEGSGMGLTAQHVFEEIATTDVREACDIFQPVVERTAGADGFVSIEVSPAAANDADATVIEARRLWAAIDRPNVMIKVPGTEAGAAAVRRLIADGINVNVTLLFSLEAYQRVIEAYTAGLEERTAAGRPIASVHSVASFFVSRVDTEIDRRLTALMTDASPSERDRLAGLHGRAAIANAKLAYDLFRRSCSTERWKALAARGATVQRPLWASTSTKNPAYRDVLYVEELIGPDTVNTLPPQTLEAFRDHGRVERTVDRGLDEARHALGQLERLGISMDDVTDQLLREGLASFQKSYDSLIAGLERKTRALGRALVG